MVRLMFETVVVTFGMFSALPMPRVDWTPRSMRWALACLPLVGFACGGALALWRILRCNPFSRGGYDPVPEELRFFHKHH